MTISSKVSFKLRDPEKHEEAVFSIDEANESALRKYLAEALRLEAALLRQGGFGASYNVSWSVGEQLCITGTEPTSDQRAAVLHHLRPFLLEDEPYSFKRVRGILARSSSSLVLTEWLQQVKQRYAGNLLQSQVKIEVGALLLNSETVLNKWLNAYEYHRDDNKAIELVKQHDPIPVDSSRPIFAMMLQEKATAVLHMGWLINQILALRDFVWVDLG